MTVVNIDDWSMPATRDMTVLPVTGSSSNTAATDSQDDQQADDDSNEQMLISDNHLREKGNWLSLRSLTTYFILVILRFKVYQPWY